MTSSTTAADPKDTVLVFQSPTSRRPSFVKALGRDGSWEVTFQAEKARRFTAASAQAALSKLIPSSGPHFTATKA